MLDEKSWKLKEIKKRGYRKLLKFENLEVYKKSLTYIQNIYDIIKKYPADERYSISFSI